MDQKKSYRRFIVGCRRLLLAALFMGLLSLGCAAVSGDLFEKFLMVNQPLHAQDAAFRAVLYLLVGFVNLAWLQRAQWRPWPLVAFSSIMCAVGLVVGWLNLVQFIAVNNQGFGYVIAAIGSLAVAFLCLLKCSGLIAKIRSQYFLWKHQDLIREMIDEAGLS
ncbi:hypothetical protein KSF_036760 [Reticulibacter mediterranei]|uniref:Uncharacterized protein n=1 Tax=Reticulibacter mediterranei TaxID=2778369 RepID=A0A8J3IJJ4_9CHLR|nr:hypothetical protein [Reticulibacter mediterranei]GHO93628.1 hypothetical protein KSF_036760 [Reticulibacter mediterranei]